MSPLPGPLVDLVLKKSVLSHRQCATKNRKFQSISRVTNGCEDLTLARYDDKKALLQ